jgi:hypothetical protein
VVASHDFALRSKLVHQCRSVYHKIGGLTLLKTIRDSARISVGDSYFVSRGSFKIRDQSSIAGCKATAHRSLISAALAATPTVVPIKATPNTIFAETLNMLRQFMFSPPQNL